MFQSWRPFMQNECNNILTETLITYLFTDNRCLCDVIKQYFSLLLVQRSHTFLQRKDQQRCVRRDCPEAVDYERHCQEAGCWSWREEMCEASSPKKKKKKKEKYIFQGFSRLDFILCTKLWSVLWSVHINSTLSLLGLNSLNTLLWRSSNVRVQSDVWSRYCTVGVTVAINQKSDGILHLSLLKSTLPQIEQGELQHSIVTNNIPHQIQFLKKRNKLYQILLYYNIIISIRWV